MVAGTPSGPHGLKLHMGEFQDPHVLHTQASPATSEQKLARVLQDVLGEEALCHDLVAGTHANCGHARSRPCPCQGVMSGPDQLGMQDIRPAVYDGAQGTCAMLSSRACRRWSNAWLRTRPSAKVISKGLVNLQLPALSDA